MATNDYYYDSSNQQHHQQQQQQQPTHHFDPGAQHASSPYESSSSAQSYRPGPRGSSLYGAPPNLQVSGIGHSPFESVFDDQPYPTSPQNWGAGAPSDGSHQWGLYQDTAYYGGGGGGAVGGGGVGGGGGGGGAGGAGLQASSPSPSPSPHDIPLQDHPGKKGHNGDDHIYDAPASRADMSRSRASRATVELGELGMLKSNKKRFPWLVWLLSVIQIGVFIAEIVKNGIMTGSPIMIKPQFNPMIGPSTQVMINMGARYAPCMHNIKEIQGRNASSPIFFLCPNATENTQICPLSTLCGFGGSVPDPVFDGDAAQSPRPDQWYRFIIPIFMHAGLIHIGFNLLMQLTIGKEMEVAIGPIRFFLVYMSAGIFGFVMGGNFAAPGIASTGASGSLFGIIALTLLDLLYSWRDRRNPIKDLAFIFLDMVISFVLGLLPGLDNFSHIGGFLTGLAVGICVLHSPNSLRRRLGQGATYSAVDSGVAPFYKSPVGFFRGRKPLWWAWWLVRVAALIVIIVVFILMLNNFYNVDGKKCAWCKYLSCIPVNNWCDLGQIQD